MRGDVARSGFSRVVKGHKPSVIEDTDTLVPSIGQFILSQNHKLRFIQTDQCLSIY